jgi:alkanesulfonate monooxygenase SsuD/methylene tetrahydromethanopterin reductase-like flavin-dependent oxidoreductase (luciferase family)
MAMEMRFGTVVRSQIPAGDDTSRHFTELMEQARLAEKLGFDSFTKASHYSTHPLQDFAQVPFLARLSAEAPKLRLNAGIVLLSLHKPLDIAEQFATLDVISGGKLIFGAALGYREVEFKAFGTTQAERVQRFEENLEAVKRLWTEDKVTMTGSHFELEEANCSMRPLQQPRPPIWIGANADAAIRRAARIGDAWYINPHNRIDTIERQTEIYKRALDEAAKPFPDEFPIRREIFVAPTRHEAIRICRPYLAEKYRVYHQWGQDKAMPEGDDDLGQGFDDLARGRFLLGAPDEITEQILRLVKVLGVNHLIVGFQWPGMPQSQVLETMQLFAEEVMPKVKNGV